MHVSEMMSERFLNKMIEEKYINVRTSPLCPGLRIFNYSERAAFDAVWNAATTQCRGLILDAQGNVVARPFAKFFNYGERGPTAPAHEKLIVSDKMDGSMGTAFMSEGKVRIATRGSMESEQAIHATALLQEKYSSWVPSPGFTYLFEIIYPANRIVVDYGEVDDLVLLAILDNETGETLLDVSRTSFYIGRWPGPVVNTHSFPSVESVLASVSEEVKNHEGFVMYFPESNVRIKVKREEYKRLHAILTNVSSYAIWEMMRTNSSFEEMLTMVPDEFYAWVTKTQGEIQREFDTMKMVVESLFLAVADRVNLPPAGAPREDRSVRKAFALAAKDLCDPSLFPMVMMLYMDKLGEIDEPIWDLVKPEYARPNYAGVPE